MHAHKLMYPFVKHLIYTVVINTNNFHMTIYTYIQMTATSRFILHVLRHAYLYTGTDEVQVDIAMS